MRPHTTQRGDLLLDALLALTLLGFVALTAVGLGHAAVHLGGEAAHLDAAVAVARECLTDLDQVSWHRLPEYFDAADTQDAAVVDTAAGRAPTAWLARAAALPDGRIVARLEGMVTSGTVAPFQDSIGLRLTLAVSYREGQRRRFVNLRTVRL